MDLTNGNNRAVLVIDSDRSGAERLESILIERGYMVHRAASAKEALRLAKEKRIVLALLALGRPGLDPKRLIKSLKRVNDDQNIPVIVILESFAEGLVASALRSGAVDYLTWPVDSQELSRRIEVRSRLKEDNRDQMEHLVTSGVGLFFTSKSGQLLECNETLVKMLGYRKKEDLLHRNVEETIYYNPEDRKKFRKAIENKGMVKDFQVTFRHKNGDPISILITGQVVHDDEGDIVGYRGENIPMHGHEPPSLHKRLLAGLFPRLSGGFHSLFSASELLGYRYEKVARLGIGSFGEVWKVRDMLKDPPEIFVAKIPLSKKLNLKIQKEARILKSLAGHNGVPEVREVIDVINKRVLIQEFVHGKTLDEVIERELEDKEVESVVIQLTDIVAYAHDIGIIHRDIKPGNIMVEPNGALKLLDFGAAKELKEKEMSDTVTGSRPYMSPEQIMGKSQRRSDVWAIGVVMYVLYTGMFPFYHDVEKVLMDMILELPSPSPSKFNESIDPEIERIIMKCLEKRVENRYIDAGALKEDITTTFPGYGEKKLPLY